MLKSLLRGIALSCVLATAATAQSLPSPKLKAITLPTTDQGSTGEAGGLTATPNAAAAAGTLAKRFSDINAVISTACGGRSGVVAADRLPLLVVCPSLTTAQINAVISAAPAGATVTFAPGSYAIAQTQSGAYDGSNTTAACWNEPFGLIVQNKTDLTLDFSNAKLINQGTDVANYYHTLCLDGNARATIRNGIADYARLPFTQGTVTAVSLTSGNQSLTFTADDASYIPSFTTVQRIEKYSVDPTTFGDYLGTVHNNEPATLNFPISCSGTSCTVTNTNTSQQMAAVSVGDRILAEGRIYDGDAVRLVRNKGVTFDNFRVWSAPGMGFKAYGWASGQVAQQDIVFQNGSGVELPPGRAQSTNADCVHMQGVRGKFTFAGGVLEGCRDDAINVYDFHSTITSISGTTLGLSSVRGWAPQDTLRVISPAGVIRGAMKLASMTGNGGPFDTGSISVNALPSGTATGDLIESYTGAADMTVLNSRIGKSRGHGILANGRRIKIANNVFGNMQKTAAILIRMLSNSFDQGIYPDIVDIIGNTLDNVNMPSFGSTVGGIDPGAIVIDVVGTNGTETNTCQLFNVHIEGNTIANTAGPGIYASGACGGRIATNTISNWGAFPGNRYGSYTGPANAAISLGYGSTSLKIGPNTFVGTSGPFVGGLTAATRAAIGYQNQPQIFADTAYWDGNGSKSYSASQGQTSLYIQAGSNNAPTYTAGLAIGLPPNPSDFDTFEVQPAFNVPAANLAMGSPDHGTVQSNTSATGLTANVTAKWQYLAYYSAWYRVN